MSQALLALEDFLALSEAMAKAAETQEWEDLARLGEKRNLLSDQLPTSLAASLLLPELARGRTIIERCQQLDAQTRSLANEQQKALRILLREPTPVI